MNWTARLFRSSNIPVFVALLIALVMGCANSTTPVNPSGSATLSELMRWHPLEEGAEWQYTSTQGDITYRVTDVTSMQSGLRAELEVERDFLTVEYAFWRGNSFRRSNMKSGQEDFIELLAPLDPGHSWRMITRNTDNSTFFADATVIDTAHMLEVPAGSFKTLVVRSLITSDYPNSPLQVDTSYSYYAKDVGVVMWDESGLKIMLESFTPGVEN